MGMDSRPKPNYFLLMPSLTNLTPELATLLDAPVDMLNFRRQRVHCLMQSEAPRGTKFGTGHPVPATSTNVAAVVLAQLDAAPVDKITERTQRFWRAAFAQREAVCPVTHARTAGEAVTKLIEDAEFRAGLDYVELEKATCTLSLVWQPDTEGEQRRPSVFHAFKTTEAWERALQKARKAPIPLARLAGDLLNDVANVLQGFNAED
jgi:hypothetical protein